MPTFIPDGLICGFLVVDISLHDHGSLDAELSWLVWPLQVPSPDIHHFQLVVRQGGPRRPRFDLALRCDASSRA